MENSGLYPRRHKNGKLNHDLHENVSNQEIRYTKKEYPPPAHAKCSRFIQQTLPVCSKLKLTQNLAHSWPGSVDSGPAQASHFTMIWLRPVLGIYDFFRMQIRILFFRPVRIRVRLLSDPVPNPKRLRFGSESKLTLKTKKNLKISPFFE